MSCAALRVVNGVVGGRREQDAGERLLDRLLRAAPTAEVIPPTLTDLLPLLDRRVTAGAGFLWVDCGYTSSDEGSLLTAPAHRRTPRYLGSDALGWYGGGFLPALIQLLLLREEVGVPSTAAVLEAAAASFDELRLCWFAVRALDAPVVDLVAPFVSNFAARGASHDGPSGVAAASSEALQPLPIRDVRGFVEHVERVAVTPSFSRAREHLSHVFWFTLRGVSYVVCVVHEAHTEVFTKVLTSPGSLCGPHDHPLSFLHCMQAVKLGLWRCAAVPRTPRGAAEPRCEWCVRVGSHQWEDPLDAVSMLQRLQDIPPFGASAVAPPAGFGAAAAESRHGAAQEELQPTQRRRTSVRRITPVEAQTSRLPSAAATVRDDGLSASSRVRSPCESRCTSWISSEAGLPYAPPPALHLGVVHMREQLVAEKEQLRQEAAEAQRATARHAHLRCEERTLQEEAASLRKRLASLRHDHAAEENGMRHASGGGPAAGAVEHLQQEAEKEPRPTGRLLQFTPQEIEAHYETVREQLRRNHQSQLSVLAKQQQEEEAAVERFCAEQAARRHREAAASREELRQIQDDIAAAARGLRCLEADAARGPRTPTPHRRRSDTAVETPCALQMEEEEGAAGTATPLLQKEQDELERLETEAELLQEGVDRARASVHRLVVSLHEGHERRGRGTPPRASVAAYNKSWHAALRCSAQRTLLATERLCRARIEREYSQRLLAVCKQWHDELDCVALHSPLTTALHAARAKYATLQAEWETAQHTQMHRQHAAERELDTVRESHAELWREVQALREQRSRLPGEQRRVVAELQQQLQGEAATVLRRITAVVAALARESLGESNERRDGRECDVRRALETALAAGCHRAPRQPRQTPDREAWGVVQGETRKPFLAADLALMRETCEAYKALCAGVLERHRLEAEVRRLSGACDAVAPTLSAERHGVGPRQQSRPQLAAVAAAPAEGGERH
ncbi:uncharacterized protein Tco025E_00389 [Trypanosoma conorhini]|uniref:Uncharacterized protein n=1 Tax=Trypanosoma conorhini TaxID=83891 RepID=A0A3R7LHJ2_9TRYP|nr:uncharacterized protein Tco025E_00389 [Trypanosoma conorhini]RNF27390.1 hypothetical protein Tco025E_00389 [Trypanosoma conorhini]